MARFKGEKKWAEERRRNCGEKKGREEREKSGKRDRRKRQ